MTPEEIIRYVFSFLGGGIVSRRSRGRERHRLREGGKRANVSSLNFSRFTGPFISSLRRPLSSSNLSGEFKAPTSWSTSPRSGVRSKQRRQAFSEKQRLQ
jgi:hypothetical protein